MGEYSTFITEYIYCKKCYKACKKVFKTGIYIHSRKLNGIPVIAGLVKNTSIEEIERAYINKIQKLMCKEPDHILKISVISEISQPYTFIFNHNHIFSD